jgi:PAS domain S-box-containing protein
MISFQSLAVLVNIGIAVGIAMAALRQRGGSGTSAMLALCFFIALWSGLYVPFADPQSPGIGPLAAAIIYFSALMAGSCLLWLILVRTNRRRWISGRNVALASIMPMVSQIAFWTRAPQHGNSFPPVAPDLAGLFVSDILEQALGLYLAGITFLGFLVVLDALVKRHRRLLSTHGLATIGSALPPVAMLLELTGYSPLPAVEVMPFAFALATATISAGLMRRRPEEIGAIDRHETVEAMDEGWLVLDNHNNIVDMNPAAERMTGMEREEAYGKPITTVLGDSADLDSSFGASQEVEMKRSLRLEEGWRYLNIRISTLTDRKRAPFGRLTLWRDMTERRQMDESRQRARDEMFVLLNAISSAASNTLSLDDFLLESIYHIIYPFRSQIVGIFLLDEKNKKPNEPRFQLASHLGLPAPALDELAYIPAASPLFNWVMNNGAPVQVEEAADDDRVPGALRRLAVASLLMLPLLAQAGDDTKFLGCLCLARKDKPAYSQDEIVRLSTISEHMASLIDSDRRRKLTIAMNERERLMRDLHDSVSQKLYGLVTTTEAAQAALEAGSTVDPAQEFARIGENARQAVKEMRLFLYQMQQIDVEKEGLISVLHHRLSAVEGRADIKARLLTDEEEIALPTDQEITLYYIAQEALNNVLRHAHAKSVLVTLRQSPKSVILEIEDDGCGFDLRKVDRAGLGLQNMRERTMQVNGRLKIISRPDQGTKIVVTVPREPSMAAAIPADLT